ncbi:hypothetical protein [Thiothrix unzii]|uniref:GIY-YIG domain-containing protein n=1 Tax=Thiothrix unzii TaxID=111769 RepID=A0A975FC79_9GAMM|nr:hypothetical protein [Thiothrix unzii]QTR54908.1 hypothetical protein J9260_07470 [Thiothrix unzii]
MAVALNGYGFSYQTMHPNKDTVISWGCVFKITFPNGKIYVGSDTASTARLDFFKYFGSPRKAKTDMLHELGAYLTTGDAYVLQKEILYAQENVKVGDILRVEQQYIKALNAKDPSIGYNR